ncbi:MAG: hypothetical protein AAB669_01315 [Patescibacteria group bacterium]
MSDSQLSNEPVQIQEKVDTQQPSIIPPHNRRRTIALIVGQVILKTVTAVFFSMFLVLIFAVISGNTSKDNYGINWLGLFTILGSVGYIFLIKSTSSKLLLATLIAVTINSAPSSDVGWFGIYFLVLMGYFLPITIGIQLFDYLFSYLEKKYDSKLLLLQMVGEDARESTEKRSRFTLLFLLVLVIATPLFPLVTQLPALKGYLESSDLTTNTAAAVRLLKVMAAVVSVSLILQIISVIFSVRLFKLKKTSKSLLCLIASGLLLLYGLIYSGTVYYSQTSQYNFYKTNDEEIKKINEEVDAGQQFGDNIINDTAITYTYVPGEWQQKSFQSTIVPGYTVSSKIRSGWKSLDMGDLYYSMNEVGTVTLWIDDSADGGAASSAGELKSTKAITVAGYKGTEKIYGVLNGEETPSLYERYISVSINSSVSLVVDFLIGKPTSNSSATCSAGDCVSRIVSDFETFLQSVEVSKN